MEGNRNEGWRNAAIDWFEYKYTKLNFCFSWVLGHSVVASSGQWRRPDVDLISSFSLSLSLFLFYIITVITVVPCRCKNEGAKAIVTVTRRWWYWLLVAATWHPHYKKVIGRSKWELNSSAAHTLANGYNKKWPPPPRTHTIDRKSEGNRVNPDCSKHILHTHTSLLRQNVQAKCKSLLFGGD